jgi:hypothetical protein
MGSEHWLLADSVDSLIELIKTEINKTRELSKAKKKQPKTKTTVQMSKELEDSIDEIVKKL